MTDLKPDHPAVQVGCQAASEWAEDASMDETDHIALALHMTAACITAALPHLESATEENLARLRDTPAGRELMAETWSKFQGHYAAEWEEAYPEDIFPSPAPPPAVVSRESVAASMMRQWAKNLRADHNPFEEDNA